MLEFVHYYYINKKLIFSFVGMCHAIFVLYFNVALHGDSEGGQKEWRVGVLMSGLLLE